MVVLWIISFIIWLAFTGTSEWSVILAGLFVSFFCSRLFCMNVTLRKSRTFFVLLCKAVITAYKEAFDLILSYGHKKGYLVEYLDDPSPWGIFQEVFLVTLTPKTVAVKVDNCRDMLVHRFEEDN